MSTTTLETPETDTVGTNRWYLSAAPIVRALVHLCVPMAAAMIVGAVYNLINAGFIGSLHDTSLLAAITFGTPVARPGHGGRRRLRRRWRRAHLAAARRGRTRAGEGRRDQARRIVRRLGVGDRRGGLRRRRASPAAPARLTSRRGCRRSGRDQRLRRRHAGVRPRARRGVLSRTARPGRRRRATGDDRPDRLHRREPRVRRAVHPRAALGRRRRSPGDGPLEPRRRGLLRHLAAAQQRAREPRTPLVHARARAC